MTDYGAAGESVPTVPRGSHEPGPQFQEEVPELEDRPKMPGVLPTKALVRVASSLDRSHKEVAERITIAREKEVAKRLRTK